MASERRQALAGGMGYRALTVNCRNPDEAADTIARLAARKSLDAVVAVDDEGVLVAALAGQRLGLAHNPPDAAARSRDKAAMRRALEDAGVSQPEFRMAGPDAEVARLAAEVGLPCVVKPVSLSGSRGVIRADDREAAVVAARRVRAILADAGEDPDAPLLVERYIPVMKSPSRACFGVGPSSPSRCSTSPIRWRAPTLRKLSTSPRPASLRRCWTRSSE